MTTENESIRSVLEKMVAGITARVDESELVYEEENYEHAITNIMRIMKENMKEKMIDAEIKKVNDWEILKIKEKIASAWQETNEVLKLLRKKKKRRAD